MSELAITKIDQLPLHSGGKSWVGDEAWATMARLKPGEMLEITHLLGGRKTHNINATFQWGLPRRGLMHLKVVRRADRIFIVYPPGPRDGAG